MFGNFYAKLKCQTEKWRFASINWWSCNKTCHKLLLKKKTCNKLLVLSFFFWVIKNGWLWKEWINKICYFLLTLDGDAHSYDVIPRQKCKVYLVFLYQHSLGKSLFLCCSNWKKMKCYKLLFREESLHMSLASHLRDYGFVN